jgi:hypothetical protein
LYFGHVVDYLGWKNGEASAVKSHGTFGSKSRANVS